MIGRPDPAMNIVDEWGESLTITIALQDDDGNPDTSYDGCSWKGQVKRSKRATAALLEFDIDDSDAGVGATVVCELAYAAIEAAAEPDVTYVFDIRRTGGPTDRRIAPKGTVRWERTVTKGDD